MARNPSLRMIIPSFNRGCQLECILRSIHERCPDAKDFSICAFYRFSESEFGEGYEIVKQLYPNVEFVEQSFKQSCKEQILALVGNEPFFSIWVDDNVVLDGFGVKDSPFEMLWNRKDLFSLSLRLDSSKTYCQPSSQAAAPPVNDENYIWRWRPQLSRRFRTTRFIDRYILKSAACDWAMPCSLDGTVFRTDFFRSYFKTVEEFSNIPFLEKALIKAAFADPTLGPKMIRYPRAKILNLAMNTVDIHHQYPSFGLDAKQFNDRFLLGDRLDYEPFRKIIFHACHVACGPFWLPRHSE